MNADPTRPERRAFDAVATSARAARRYVGDLLRLEGAPVEVINDYELVVSELVTNAVEHGPGDQLEIVLDFSDPECWQLDVVGGSPVAPKQISAPDTWSVAAANAISGRGLGIVRQLMDEVVITAGHGRITVTCRRRRAA